jgi:hypothetical protein
MTGETIRFTDADGAAWGFVLEDCTPLDRGRVCEAWRVTTGRTMRETDRAALQALRTRFKFGVFERVEVAPTDGGFTITATGLAPAEGG